MEGSPVLSSNIISTVYNHLEMSKFLTICAMIFDTRNEKKKETKIKKSKNQIQNFKSNWRVKMIISSENACQNEFIYY